MIAQARDPEEMTAHNTPLGRPARKFFRKKDLQEKLNIDKQTVPGSLVFFVERSFYSGYERTAFLSARLLPPLKVNCRYYKSVGQTVAVIGFPTSYIPKYAANFPMERREGMLLLKVPADTPYAENDFEA